MAEIMTQRKNKQKLCVKENKETFPRKEIVETLQNSRSKNFWNPNNFKSEQKS